MDTTLLISGFLSVFYFALGVISIYLWYKDEERDKIFLIDSGIFILLSIILAYIHYWLICYRQPAEIVLKNATSIHCENFRFGEFGYEKCYKNGTWIEIPTEIVEFIVLKDPVYICKGGVR